MAETERSQSQEGPDTGPIRVMATGVFDLLHPGHLHFLSGARELGDELIVVVARDVTAAKFKHLPIVPEHLRVQMVGALKPVDKAVLGDPIDYFKVVEAEQPHIIALGYDQHWDEKKLAASLEKRGLTPRIERLKVLQHDLLATRRIITRILELYEGAADPRRRAQADSEQASQGEDQ